MGLNNEKSIVFYFPYYISSKSIFSKCSRTVMIIAFIEAFSIILHLQNFWFKKSSSEE